jgi:hypothetical protein
MAARRLYDDVPPDNIKAIPNAAPLIATTVGRQWQFTDSPTTAMNFRYWSNSGHYQDWREMARSQMSQSGH